MPCPIRIKRLHPVNNAFLLLLLLACFAVVQRAGGQVIYATTQANDAYSCAIGCGVGTGVSNPGNSVSASLADSSIITSNKAVLGVNGGNAYLQMQFASNLPAGSTVYIKVGTPTVTGLVYGLLGILGLVNSNIYVDAYLGAGTSPVSASASNNFRMLRNGNGELFLVITPPAVAGVFDAVRIRVEAPADLVSSVKLPVYYAKYDNTVPSCTEMPAYTNLGSITGTSINLSAAVSNPQNAIDNSAASFSALTTGVVALGAKVSQTVYFSNLSASGDEVRVLMAIPPSLLSLSLLDSISVQTFNGATATSSEQSLRQALLGLDLLTLFGSNNIVPVYFTSTSPFDRVVLACRNVLAVAAATVNVYDVKRVPGKPSFTSPLNDTVFTCSGNAVALSVDPVGAGYQLKWYASNLPADITALQTGSNYTTPALTTATTYWIAKANTACPTESERVPDYALVWPLPDMTFASSFDACQSLSQFFLPYTNPQNSPTMYQIAWSPVALSAYFLPVSYTSLPASPVPVTMPVPRAATGSYTGIFYLKNSNNCERSYPFTVVVKKPPDPHPATSFQ